MCSQRNNLLYVTRKVDFMKLELAACHDSLSMNQKQISGFGLLYATWGIYHKGQEIYQLKQN